MTAAAESIGSLGGRFIVPASADPRLALPHHAGRRVRGHGRNGNDLALQYPPHVAEGHPTETLQWLDRAGWPRGADLFESEAYDRWLRAEALEAIGRREDALAWYGTMGERSAMEVAYLVPAAYRMAELNYALGHGSEAKRHYERVTALWSGADAELREYVERAPSRLEGVP